MPPNDKIPRTLTIAGSDSGGGAGIEADLRTFALLHCFGMAAVTAVTAQDTREVYRSLPIDGEMVSAQIQAVAEDIGIDAAKTGMLGTAETVDAVADTLASSGPLPLVVDPVMVAKGGAQLLDPPAVARLRQRLLPLAEVVTPNLPEAEALANRPIQTDEDRIDAAKEIAAYGAHYVVIKGGHASGERADDLVYHDGTITWLSAPRLGTRNTHGTGCTFSAAITAGLAWGLSVEDALTAAKRYITAAIAQGLPLGHGHGPTNGWAGAAAWQEGDTFHG
ncbi:MAG: bifunctional hydroxymethylpyrimidine kinase/phosphomethylpyrimidine kinase [Firmicutes bacterium]|nr:bifunctional hydroxymethylpyrimidine kinase/phosphomethylpyrimidine kinase [Bacillota bacterium]